MSKNVHEYQIILDKKSSPKMSFGRNKELAKRGSINRSIVVEPTIDLYEFGQIILGSFGFEFDHNFGFGERPNASFFADQIRYETLVDHEADEMEESLPTKGVMLAEVFPEKGAAMRFYFDYGDSWNFRVKLLKIRACESGEQVPGIVRLVGKSPNQYEYSSGDIKELKEESMFVLSDGRKITNFIVDDICNDIMDESSGEYFFDLGDLETFYIPREHKRKLECFLNDTSGRIVLVPRVNQAQMRELMRKCFELQEPMLWKEYELERLHDERLANADFKALLDDESLSWQQIEDKMKHAHGWYNGAWLQYRNDYLWEILKPWLCSPPINAKDNLDYWLCDDCAVCSYTRSTEEGWLTPTKEGLEHAFDEAQQRGGQRDGEER